MWHTYPFSKKAPRPKQLDSCLLTIEFPLNGTPFREVWPAVYTEVRGFLLTCPNNTGKGLKTVEESNPSFKLIAWMPMPLPYAEEDPLS